MMQCHCTESSGAARFPWRLTKYYCLNGPVFRKHMEGKTYAHIYVYIYIYIMHLIGIHMWKKRWSKYVMTYILQIFTRYGVSDGYVAKQIVPHRAWRCEDEHKVVAEMTFLLLWTFGLSSTNFEFLLLRRNFEHGTSSLVTVPFEAYGAFRTVAMALALRCGFRKPWGDTSWFIRNGCGIPTLRNIPLNWRIQWKIPITSTFIEF